MNSDFWPARGSSSGNNFQPMMDTTNDYHQRNQANDFSNNNNNTNENGVDMKDHLISGQDNQNSFNQSQSGFQQQPAPVSSPGTENSSPESKFNADKFVNEIQVRREPNLVMSSVWSILGAKNNSRSSGRF